MTDKQIEALVRDIVGEADYDLAKQLDPKTAEEPHEAKPFMARMVAIARKHMPAAKGERKRRAPVKRSTP